MREHLKIHKSSGEVAIRILKNSGAIDHGFSIIRAGEFLLIPLAFVPSAGDLPGEVVKHEEEPREKRPYPSRISGSYDVIGHIAISKEKDPAKLKELAEGLLNSGKGIKSVYFDGGVKGDTRIRDLALIAGEDAPVATYRENGIILKVDVTRVYFSPRLATERLLLSSKVASGEKIVDMFSGVGSFAINIASKVDAHITAIDINAAAVSLMRDNILINRLKGTVEPVLADSTATIREYGNMDRIIMNLPHGAHSHVRQAMWSLREGGRINYYEICDFEGLEYRLEEFRELGLTVAEKREVHAYSSRERMYSVELIKGSQARS